MKTILVVFLVAAALLSGCAVTRLPSTSPWGRPRDGSIYFEGGNPYAGIVRPAPGASYYRGGFTAQSGGGFGTWVGGGAHERVK